MKITIESTDALVDLTYEHGAVPARVWEGKTDSGIPVQVFITRISPQTHSEAANKAFAAELKETRRPIFAPFDREGPIDPKLLRVIL